MQYYFEWDPKKALVNETKHKISFENACSVFRDPRALSVFDHMHSDSEERWMTIGISEDGILLVVSHTFRKEKKYSIHIRIISARKATKREKDQY
jgi:uncharacterized protein